jgi:hypothetical protein
MIIGISDVAVNKNTHLTAHNMKNLLDVGNLILDFVVGDDTPA